MKFLHITAAVLALMLISGCSESDERRHPLFLKGVKAQNSGDGNAAAANFRELLKRRPKSVYAHLKLAAVYDEMLNEPLMAIMHYKLYLAALPDAPDAAEVTAWIEQSEKRCYELLKARFEPPQIQAPNQAQAAAPAVVTTSSTATPADLLNPSAAPEASSQTSGNTATASEAAAAPPENSSPAAPPETALSAAEAEIARLKTLLTQYKARHSYMLSEIKKLRWENPSAAPTVPAPETMAATTAQSSDNSKSNHYRTYKVLPGDTPGKIARKLYGKSSLYKVILQANPAVNERNLKPGMILNIPEKPTR